MDNPQDPQLQSEISNLIGNDPPPTDASPAASPTPTSEIPSVSAPANGAGLKILIVDDDEMLLGIFSAVFEQEGFTIMIAHDGQEAWDMMTMGKIPHVVLTGINMPRMTGFQLVTKMKTDDRFKNIPVAMSSHRGLPEHQEIARNLGIKEFLVQSMTPPPEIIRRVRALLGASHVFHITLSPQEPGMTEFIEFLKAQQTMTCTPGRPVILSITPQAADNTFTITIRCA